MKASKCASEFSLYLLWVGLRPSFLTHKHLFPVVIFYWLLKADENSCWSFFSQFGVVQDFSVVMDQKTNQSKGFGFVTFQDAQAATFLKSMGVVQLMGRNVNIGEAHKGKNAQAQVGAPNPAAGMMGQMAQQGGMGGMMGAMPGMSGGMGQMGPNGMGQMGQMGGMGGMMGMGGMNSGMGGMPGADMNTGYNANSGYNTNSGYSGDGSYNAQAGYWGAGGSQMQMGQMQGGAAQGSGTDAWNNANTGGANKALLPTITTQMKVSSPAAGAIIGRGGANLKSMMAATGAKITVAKAEDGDTERQVEITGTTVQVTAATEMVTQCIAQNAAAPPKGAGASATNKARTVFVGGLSPQTATEGMLSEFFSQWGLVETVKLIYDKNTNYPKGYGFVTFSDANVANQLISQGKLDMYGKSIDLGKPGGGKDQ